MTEDDHERLVILETEFRQFKTDINDIKTKLDELLNLKSKGLGALWLIGLLLLLGSGLAEFIYNIINSVGKPHG